MAYNFDETGQLVKAIKKWYDYVSFVLSTKYFQFYSSEFFSLPFFPQIMHFLN